MTGQRPDLVAHFATALPDGYRIEHEHSGQRGGYAGWSGHYQPKETWGSYHAFGPDGEHAGRLDYSKVERPGERPEVGVQWIQTNQGHTGKDRAPAARAGSSDNG